MGPCLFGSPTSAPEAAPLTTKATNPSSSGRGHQGGRVDIHTLWRQTGRCFPPPATSDLGFLTCRGGARRHSHLGRVRGRVKQDGEYKGPSPRRGSIHVVCGYWPSLGLGVASSAPLSGPNTADPGAMGSGRCRNAGAEAALTPIGDVQLVHHGQM